MNAHNLNLTEQISWNLYKKGSISFDFSEKCPAAY